LPRAIWMLGLVSLFMDVSSEMIHALLPVFLLKTLGASALVIGLIEGAAEATAAIVKVFSGAISDRAGRRKPLTLLGYGMAALTKPLFALASGVGLVFFARIADRIGKGIRGAPRDALVADLAPASLRGAAFGLRQSMDTVGALLGPLLAILLMALLSDNIRQVFWFAVLPAMLAVAVLMFGVREPERPRAAVAPRQPLRGWRALQRPFWVVVAVGVIFQLARFSEAFLILRTQQLGLELAFTPLALVTMNLTYSLSAYPAGHWADRVPRQRLLALGLLLLIAADAALAYAPDWRWALAGAAIWGLHLGCTQGVLAALVVDTAPDTLRGTAFGVFNLLSGAALLLASVLAGALWQAAGPAWTFAAGAGLAVLALLSLARTARPVTT